MRRLGLIASLALAACSSPGAEPVAAVDGGVAAADAPIDAPAARAVEVLTSFDASKGELPEGLAIAGDTAYVGFAPTSTIVRVDLKTRAVTPFAQLPKPVPNKGFMTGLAIDASGTVYAGLVSFAPEVQAGIYRVPASGGDATLFAKDAAMPFPNGLAFDARGALFVTDSGSGSVFRVSRGGEVERWSHGDALTGKMDACGPGPSAGFDIGANGIVVDDDAVHVVNNDRATLVRIARAADGKAAEPKVVAGPDCANLGGADGLIRAPNGDFLVALNRQDKLVRITAGGSTETLFTGAPLDFPASFAWHEGSLVTTNFALFTASGGRPASPGLLRVRLP